MHVIRPVEKRELRVALGALLARPETSASDLQSQIDALLRHASKSRLSLDHCLIATVGGRIVTTCLCVDSPGRTASVFLPNHISSPREAEAVVTMLDELAVDAAQRGVQLVQGMTAPKSTVERDLFARAHFQRLTELIYLERDVTRPIPPGMPEPTVTWEEHGPRNHGQFAKVIQETYVGSLDCAALSGVRSIEDTLASHRATGEFDPRSWLVARDGVEPVGVVLLARLPERSSMEVVYMGLMPSARGRGYGAALLRRALGMARQRGVATLSLTVDVENAPARRLYASFGFHETSRREVWMRILRSSS